MNAPRLARKMTAASTLVWAAVVLGLMISLPSCRSFSTLPNPAKTDSFGLRAGPQVQERTVEKTAGVDETEVGGSSTEESSRRSPLSSLFPENRQVLQFVEPQTNVTVMLIGSMHYNPASIQLVEEVVEDLGASNKLASVIIESCDIRWNKTQEMMDKKKNTVDGSPTISSSSSSSLGLGNDAKVYIESNPNDKDFLGNEMRAAWEVATRYYRPTVLGDQRINITVDALKDSLKETAKDLFLSGPAGWKRSSDEIADNWKKTIPISAGSVTSAKADENIEIYDDNETKYLNAFAFFDPRLLISLPVSLVKYPLSFLVKDPVPVGTVFAIIAALNFYGDGSSLSGLENVSLEDWVAAATTPQIYDWSDYAISFLVAVLETVLFARLLLKPLLADRNEILAKSVLDQCRLYATNNKSNGNGSATPAGSGIGNWFQNLLPLSSKEINPMDSDAPIYVPGSDPKSMVVAARKAKRDVGGASGSEGKVVVAVLGMAHCNGVMKLLREQKV